MTTCPPPNRLREYLSGKLDSASSSDLAQHLQDCARCEQTATQMELEPDTLVELLQSDLPVRPPSDPNSAISDSSRPSDSSAVSSDSHDVMTSEMPRELGQYELLSRLGNGGMGAVYLARHKSLDKQVALKFLPALPAQNAEFVARFQREMRAAGKLDHPAIVRTTDAGEHSGIHFLVMDAIDGMNLSSIARAEEKLAVADACEVIRQAAAGLAHAHEKGIVHRDVKPSNLMLDINGQVRILDFGLAQIGFWDLGSAEITTVGQLMGTLDYMAPEQAERGGAVDYRADLYSLGATLFRLLTGRAPLAAAPNLTPLEKLRLLATHKPPKLRSLRADVPDSLGQIVDAMLSSDPAARPASATHAAELLEPFTAGADLIGLLQHARSKPKPDDDSFVVSPLLRRNLATDNPAGPSRETKQSRPIGSRWFILAGCFAMLLAGIAFVLELGKGQLVIDSEADVHVKIVSVDPQGKRSEVDELQIEPGTKTTRLKGGKYEITLDAPSDSFGVTNQTFTIRNGETVVATITSRSNADAPNDQSVEHAGAMINAQEEDPRLSEVVYDGESLDTWLRRLKYERNPQEVSRTLNAINALADEELKDVIEQPLIDFALTVDSESSAWFGQIAPALKRCNGDRYPAAVAVVLSQLDESEQLSFLRYAFGSFDTHIPASVDYYTEFLDVTATMLANDSSRKVTGTASILRVIADRSTGENATLLQARIVKLLTSASEVTDEAFWLELPAVYNFGGAKRSIIGVKGCDAFDKEVTKRAIKVIGDPQSTVPLITQAALVLASLIESGHELTAPQRVSLSKYLAPILQQTAKRPDDAFDEVSVPRELLSNVAPITPLGKFRDTSGRCACKPIAIANLIRAAALQDALRSELTAVFESLQQRPLYGTDYTVDYFRNPDQQDWDRLVRIPRGSFLTKLLSRAVYLQAGFLIGRTETELFARFEKKLPADIALEVNAALDLLDSGTDSQQRDAMAKLAEVMPPMFSPRAAEIIQRQFTRNAVTFAAFGSSQLNRFVGVWAKATGDDFLASYVHALIAADTANREALLRISFYEIEDFICNDPNELKPFLDLCDQILNNPDVEPNRNTWSFATLLSGLLVDRPGISRACQQKVVEHMENYSLLDEHNYWFLQTIDNRNCLPARLAILRKAIEQINDESGDNGERDCRALAILASGVNDIDDLSDDQQQNLINQIRRRLIAAADNPTAFVATLRLPRGFDQQKPQCLGGFLTNVMGGGSVEPANSVILVLNLLTDMTETSSSASVVTLEPELTTLHVATESLNIASRRPLIDSSTWQSTLDSASSRQDVIHHVWYLQTGALLGKDAVALNRRPTELYAAEQKRKQRFIQPGDTLAIHIPAILPGKGDPPVLQAGTSAPVIGFPVPVSAEGTIQIPLIAPLPVKGLELQQVKKSIEKVYVVEKQILRDDITHMINVQFLLRAGENVEVRNIAGSQLVPSSSNE